MWDYLVITASNDNQASSYRAQLDLRLELGLLTEVENAIVIADPGGKRIGSGGSTLFCLMEVLMRQPGIALSNMETFRDVLNSLRILIIHAGGDSKRLPGYGACGKIFIPVPGESDSCLPTTLFDRQLPTYLSLPSPPKGAGQVVITSGDVMMWFDPSQVNFNRPGLTGLGCYADLQQAADHGVYCGTDGNGLVKRFLQKPTPKQQKALGAADHYDQSILDIGVMSFDANTAVNLLDIFGACCDDDGHLILSGKMGEAVMEHGLDFYREICCGMGSETTIEDHVQMAQGSGSFWDMSLLSKLYQGLRNIDFNLQLLRHCEFVDFGTTRHIIRSGTILVQHDRSAPCLHSCLDINNDIQGNGQLIGFNSWVEGCRISSPLSLAGENIVLGAVINEPLSLPVGACLDMIAGTDRNFNATWFVRCYGVSDTFKDTPEEGGTLCGKPILEWLENVGACPDDIWDSSIPAKERSVWQGRVFPTASSAEQYRDWLWMYDPSSASEQQLDNWRASDRYSLAEIAEQANHDLFFNYRLAIRSEQIKKNLRSIFRCNSKFSAAELSYILNNTDDRTEWIASVISNAKWHYDIGKGLEAMAFPRVIHTLATALKGLDVPVDSQLQEVLPNLAEMISPAESDWLDSVGLGLNTPVTMDRWIERGRSLAFNSLGKTIIFSKTETPRPPKSTLRSDEIVWGRAPARFDTGGGWTDTPPYSLEYGGCVVNTAIDLNGQCPIQTYMRVTDDPVLSIGSIDLGTRIKITELDELLDYGEPTSKYGLVKAALALSGFSPETASWPDGVTLRNMLEAFGGGIDITTLAAIPKGSGLGTSSIMGAVILSVIHRVMGVELTQRDLFGKVLQLEQALTTGGGWQDQIGGVVGGVKIVYADRGLIPDPRIHYLPPDIIDPRTNGGMTLLYYTGITRLAKNILEQVVGRYLNRNRSSMNTLQKINDLTVQVAEAFSRKDLPSLGRLVGTAWQLNKQLDPNSTNDHVEKLFARIEPHVYGAKLLGAGGGGFMLMVCKSTEDVMQIRQKLHTDPPNDRSRFFDFNVNTEGMIITVS